MSSVIHVYRSSGKDSRWGR